jgi:hypothetical protein
MSLREYLVPKFCFNWFILQMDFLSKKTMFGENLLISI